MSAADERAALLAAVCAAPDDDAPRLAYAAWCDGRGDPRGEFIRLQVEIARMGGQRDTKEFLSRQLRIDRLLTEHKHAWTSEHRGLPIFHGYDSPLFHRGFISLIRVPAAYFCENVARLFSAMPIQHLEFAEAQNCYHCIFRVERLQQVLSIRLTNALVDDLGCLRIAECRYLKNVWYMNLSENRIGVAGVDALVHSPYLKNVEILWLYDNPCDPVDWISPDDPAWREPQESQALFEKEVGRVPWFHPPGLVVRPFDRHLRARK